MYHNIQIAFYFERSDLSTLSSLAAVYLSKPETQAAGEGKFPALQIDGCVSVEVFVRCGPRMVVREIQMGITVVEHLVYRLQLDDVISPYHLVKRFLGNDVIDVSAYIVVRGVFGIIGIIERYSQASRRPVSQLHKDALRVIAHVMPHHVAIRCIFQQLYRMCIARYVGASELAAQRQAFDGPTAPVEAHDIREGVVLRVRGLEARKLKIIEVERAV